MENIASEQIVTLHLPENLFQQAQRLAQNHHRSVEEILVDAVATALPPLAGLPAEIANDLSEFAFLDDAELWEVARSRLPAKHHEQMDRLLAQKGQGKLTKKKQHQLDQLLHEYQVHVLRRGQAAMLLQRRGHDMSDPSVLDPAP